MERFVVSLIEVCNEEISSQDIELMGTWILSGTLAFISQCDGFSSTLGIGKLWSLSQTAGSSLPPVFIQLVS
jgi:hypothetical protein